MELKLDREGLKALGAAARAFKLAQSKGYVWVSDQGTFDTCEGWLCPPAPKRSPNPDQMELA